MMRFFVSINTTILKNIFKFFTERGILDSKSEKKRLTMKKLLPILFTASTVVLTAASLVVASNGFFTPLKATDNSVSHQITFTVNDVVSVVEGYVDEITLNKQTQSGFDFGCVLSVDPGYDGKTDYDNTNIVNIKNPHQDDASISTTFQFNNVLTAESVVLNGSFDNGFNTVRVFNGSGNLSINVLLDYQNSVELNSIVVTYTCCY